MGTETRVHLAFIYELTSHPVPSNMTRSRYQPHHRSSFGPFFTSPCPPAPSGLRPKADHELLHVADPTLNPLHDGAEAAHVGAENTARSFSSCNHMPHVSNPISSMSSIHPQWRGGSTCFILMMWTEKYLTMLASKNSYLHYIHIIVSTSSLNISNDCINSHRMLQKSTAMHYHHILPCVKAAIYTTFTFFFFPINSTAYH